MSIIFMNSENSNKTFDTYRLRLNLANKTEKW